MISQSIGMNRLSIDNRYKNFITGEERQFTKIKPESLIKGSALIEIFDAVTGKKIEEIQSENIILNSLNKYLYQIVMACLINKNPAQLTNFSVANLTGQSWTVNMFGNLILTDYTGAEDAANRYVRGGIVGWANKSTAYAGADAYKGTINIASTDYTNLATIKFVFDWPTTAANGTFRTLWWTPARMDSVGTVINYSYSLPNINSGIPSSFNVNGNGRVCVKGDGFYYIPSSATTSIYKSTKTPGNIVYSAGVLVKNISGDDSAPKGVEWDGTNFWVYGNTNGKMFKYDASFNLVTSWACASATYMTAYQYTCLGGKIYTYKYVNSTTWNIYQWSTSGALEATYNVYNASYAYFTYLYAQSVTSFMSDGTYLYLFAADMILIVDGSGNVITNIACSGNGSNMYAMCFDPQKNLVGSMWIASSTYLCEAIPLFFPVVQNLLPAGITKTSANTMKITYQFNLDLSGL